MTSIKEHPDQQRHAWFFTTKSQKAFLISFLQNPFFIMTSEISAHCHSGESRNPELIESLTGFRLSPE
jgi:hypothetical protein